MAEKEYQEIDVSSLDSELAAAKTLEERIQEELRALDMPKVRFSILFADS